MIKGFYQYYESKKTRQSRYEIMKKFGTTLENAAPELFTFILYPFVYSTTNLGEQSMKPIRSEEQSSTVEE